jgi:hypothetical protein
MPIYAATGFDMDLLVIPAAAASLATIGLNLGAASR